MLMENRVEKVNGAENAEKSMSLDLQSVYNQKPWVSAVKKRGSGNGSSGSGKGVKRKLSAGDQNESRKKSKKEVLLSSLSNGKKNKSVSEVCKSRLNSPVSGNQVSQEDPGVNSGNAGYADISLNLNSNVSIPKRPRDLVRRKKVEVSRVSKQEGTSSSKASSTEGGGKRNGNAGGSLSQNGIANGELSQNGESEGTSNGCVVGKVVKRKKNSHDHKENRSTSPDLLRHLKRDGSHSSLGNGDSVTKKARRSRKKTIDSITRSPGLTVEAKPSLDESSKICDDSLDDEENLEANAARMLSSRFDPSCTGFSSGGKSSNLPSANGLSALTSSSRDLATAHANSSVDLDIESRDAEARVLRPKVQQKDKGVSRNRRRFCEVFPGDLDSYWVINRRIKVFWPLDKKWYVGHVIGYDPARNFHHVKYDDKDEEWIDLQNESFKLFLLPSEVPGEDGRKSSTAQVGKGELGDTADTTESEPIISWLARFGHHKPPPTGTKKKKRTLLGSAKSQSSSISEVKIEPQGSLDMVVRGCDADDFACSSGLPNNPVDSLIERKSIADNVLSYNDRAPIVYVRRRFRRREPPQSGGGLCQLLEKPRTHENASDFVDSIEFGADMSLSVGECFHHAYRLSNDELIWDTDCSGNLRLAIPVTSLMVFKFELSFPLPSLIGSVAEWQRYMFMLQHGALISACPMVNFEVLLVDDAAGLRFLLFEGCMKQALSFVFLILSVFDQSDQKERHHVHQLPVTSIRFRFSALQYLEKQLVFTFCSFTEVANSKWLYIDRKLKKHCMLTKELPVSECTYDNIKLLRNGSNRWKLTSVSQKPSSVMNQMERSKQRETGFSSRQSACVELSRQTFDSDEKIGRLPPFALSFSAAPSFFLSLHLRLLMERSIPSSSFGEQDPVYLMDHPDDEGGLVGADSFPVDDNSVLSSLDLAEGMPVKPPQSSQHFSVNETQFMPQVENGKAELGECGKRLSSAKPYADSKMKGCSANGVTVDIQSFVPVERNTDATDSVLDTNDGLCSPNHTASQSMRDKSRIGLNCSSVSAIHPPCLTEGKQDFLRSGFGNGPKKPRTQVSYSLPFGGQDCNSKSKFHQSKGFSHKRIRRASEKKTSEAFGTSQKNMESCLCEANILVTVGDRGWRESGARIVLELFDHNEWRLGVKISGETKYSFKAHQFVQPGTTNRYTHAMMWKGGKDWILEFLDRSQWMLFKEMHEECYNRNFRAASVKNIPIPGVRLVEENDDNVPEVLFVRPSLKYYRQLETDIEIAMNSSRVLYDMDSDDERWIMKHSQSDSNKRDCENISDEMFEKTIDVLEKFACSKQRDYFSLDELEEFTAEVGPFEAIKIIYEYWKEKRERKGLPLVRHLQPPLWEKYQQQVKEWEQVMAKSNLALSGGCPEKSLPVEKPPMFAFCLKPRGLELPNRGSKQRSQKRLPVGALSNGISGDADAFHSLAGRRLNGYAFGDDRFVYNAYNQGTSDSSPVLQGSTRMFSPRDSGAGGYFSLSSDGYERNHYPKLYRNKSKKLSFMPTSYDQQPFASYSQRTHGKRGSVYLWGSSEWPSQMPYQTNGFQRPNLEQLDPSELDEFRLRDAASAARHAVTIAKMKRENAQRMLCRADLAMHKAVAAIMTAEAVKASCGDQISDAQTSG